MIVRQCITLNQLINITTLILQTSIKNFHLLINYSSIVDSIFQFFCQVDYYSQKDRRLEDLYDFLSKHRQIEVECETLDLR